MINEAFSLDKNALREIHTGERFFAFESHSDGALTR